MLAILSACQSVDDTRLPAMPVNINLGDPGLWTAYGISGFGMYRYFIPALRLPNGFQYTANTAVGFGGVLLIGGMDPFTGDSSTPLAYDLACPVECKPGVRVRIEGEQCYAVCPECGSKYDVTMQGGAPVSGPAFTSSPKLGMVRFVCVPATAGGYIVTR